MKYVKVKQVKKSKINNIFHLTVENNHNFFANNICVHNCSYRGEILVRFKIVPRLNSKNLPILYKKGDKIGQLVIRRTYDLPIVEVSELSETVRGEGGFGSTGK